MTRRRYAALTMVRDESFHLTNWHRYYADQFGAENLAVNLAVSLNASDNPTRDEIMPINKKYPLKELLEACRNYPGLSNARRITFEYVMLKGVNDSLQDAKELVRLLKGIPSKINLIPFNKWPGSEYECSDWDKIEEFADFINANGYAKIGIITYWNKNPYQEAGNTFEFRCFVVAC